MSMCDFVLIRLTDFELYAKTQIFYKISRQIWPLTPTGRGHFLEYFKNTFTILFVGSIDLVVLIFVHIGFAGYKRQAKKWFRDEIRSNFDLRPCWTRSNLWIMKKKLSYRIVLNVKLLHWDNFCQHRTRWNQMTSQKRDFEWKFGKILTFYP